MQRFDLRKINDAEVKEQYQVKITNRFAALENFDDNVDMNRAWENIRDNIRISAREPRSLRVKFKAYLLINHLNVIISSPRSSKWAFSKMFPRQNSFHPSHSCYLLASPEM
jgi:hypothetical protein